ncbi:peptidase [Mycolicibacterium mucogenicum]|uniref:peptidase n=1 Tax=Mycolicibacterium mucogenicum TaxID=56689 RepID=UPI000AB30548|nr:peptidase [Mycolicibacterium mucogenicum]KAB7760140.1 peptidase [Mycolicibacterium mucogenicum DSM 44124]
MRATAPPLAAPTAPTDIRLADGRTAELLVLDPGSTLPGRITAELDGAVAAVTAFWGDDWRRQITIVTTGTDEEFRALAGGKEEFAAATTVDRIVFAPGAAAMGPGALRIVLRHELFHYASRPVTAADAPWCLTEGVADYVSRPRTPRPAPAAMAVLPTNADFQVTGPALSLAYDRAWWFARFVGAQFGDPVLRRLYLAACGAGHPDLDTALTATLGADRDALTAAWQRWLAAGG